MHRSVRFLHRDAVHYATSAAHRHVELAARAGRPGAVSLHCDGTSSTWCAPGNSPHHRPLTLSRRSDCGRGLGTDLQHTFPNPAHWAHEGAGGGALVAAHLPQCAALGLKHQAVDRCRCASRAAAAAPVISGSRPRLPLPLASGAGIERSLEAAPARSPSQPPVLLLMRSFLRRSSTSSRTEASSP